MLCEELENLMQYALLLSCNDRINGKSVQRTHLSQPTHFCRSINAVSLKLSLTKYQRFGKKLSGKMNSDAIYVCLQKY